MPSWKIHLIFDLIFVIVFVGTLFGVGVLDNILLLVFLILFNILATIFPDIDTPKSKIRKYVSLILALVVTSYLVIDFSLSSILSVVTTFFFIYLLIRFFPTKHRGITHRLWFSPVFSLGLTFILWLMFNVSLTEFTSCFLIILWGYLSHLILDKLT